MFRTVYRHKWTGHAPKIHTKGTRSNSFLDMQNLRMYITWSSYINELKTSCPGLSLNIRLKEVTTF